MSVSSSSRSSENKPAFTGHIANTLDALLIFEACRRGSLSRIQSRLSEPERRNIKSGDVYVFGEEESKIKRWTDGRRWSPSRIMNNFLIYKELEPPEKEIKRSTSFIPANTDTDAHDEAQPSGSSTIKRERSQSKFGDDMFNDPFSASTPPTAGSAKEKVSQIPLPGIVLQGGLIKKTISVGGLHMISYYNPADLKTGTLKTPSSVDELASLEINHIFLLAKYFRHPPQVAFGEDGMPRFVALTDEDPMPRKNSTSTSTAMGKKVKQESTTSSRHDERRPDGGAGSRTDNAGQSFFPKSEPQDDVFPEDFGALESGPSHIPPLPNRRSSTGYSSGGKYRSVPGLARSLSSASDSTATAVGEAQELQPSMRPRTGSSSGGHRHEPYRLPVSRGSSTTSPSTYHSHPGSNVKSPRHSFSMEYSPNMTHLRHSQRTDVMYTEGIGRHLRSASLSSGLGVPSRRGSMTSSPSMHAQIGIVNENAIGAISSPHSTPYDHTSPYFDSQHSYTAYSSPYMAQRPYTSPDGSVPEQAVQGHYMANLATEQLYAFPTAEVLEQQVSTEEEHARRLSMTYSPNMQAQAAWSGYQGGEISYAQHSMQHQEQYDQPSLHYMDPQQANASFGLPAGLPHPTDQQQADSVFMSGQQPYPMGEFIQHHLPTEQVANEGDSNMARNAIFQYYPPSSSSISQQHSIPLLRTEFSPLMPASASYPSSLSSLHPQMPQQGQEEFYNQAPEDQQQAGLGLHHPPAPPSYSHQQAYPANLGKAKIDYKVVEPVSWPTYTSPKVAQHQYQQPQQYPGVHPSQLHTEHPDVG